VKVFKGSRLYGKLGSKQHTPAYMLWLKKEEEPPDCEPFLLRLQLQSDPTEEEVSDYCRKLWCLLDILPPRDKEMIELKYLHGMTLKEIGDRYGITIERVRQIEHRSFRRMMHPDHMGKLGEPPLLESRRCARHPGFAWLEPLE
jgi:RNA polymerase sigma factor (sigma-70 family)